MSSSFPGYLYKLLVSILYDIMIALSVLQKHLQNGFQIINLSLYFLQLKMASTISFAPIAIFLDTLLSISTVLDILFKCSSKLCNYYYWIHLFWDKLWFCPCIFQKFGLSGCGLWNDWWYVWDQDGRSQTDLWNRNVENMIQYNFVCWY